MKKMNFFPPFLDCYFLLKIRQTTIQNLGLNDIKYLLLTRDEKYAKSHLLARIAALCYYHRDKSAVN